MKNLFILVLMLCGIVVNTNAQPLFQDHIIIQLQMQAKDLPDYSGSTQPVRRLPPYNKEQLITIANGIIYFDESLSPSILTIKNEKRRNYIYGNNRRWRIEYSITASRFW